MTMQNPRKRATLDDVAAAAGVTAATVSFTLSGKRTVTPHTREAVLQAVRELGYEPNLYAQRLAVGRAQREIALFSLNMDLGVGTRKLQRLQSALSTRGFKAPIHGYGSMVGHEAQKQVAEVLCDLRRQKPRAIVCYTSQLETQAIAELQRFQEEGGVLICYDFPIALDCDQIIFDREDNTFRAARHLVELGHRRLGLLMVGEIGGPRLRGFERALALVAAPAPFLWAGGNHLEPEAAGAQMARAFLALPAHERPTGVCVLNDAAALAFMGHLLMAGVRVPDDLSVVGHDDAPLAACSGLVPLSTVSHPVDAIVDAVMSQLCARLENPTDSAPLTFSLCGELVARNSTRALSSS